MRSGVKLGLLAGWGLLVAWLVHDVPPCVDLPAHAAQMQTVAELLRGAPAVAAHYRLTFPIGYGLTTWLFAPVAMVINGAVAARLALWLTMMALPVALSRLAQSFERSWWVGALGAPLVFSVSYWYGFLPTLFALPLVLVAWALFWELDAKPNLAKSAALAASGVAVALSHFIALGVLGAGFFALMLASRHRGAAARRLATALLVPSLLCLPRGIELLTRASNSAANVYDAAGHFNWAWRAYGAMGWPEVVASVAMVALAFGTWLRRRHNQPRAPAFLFAAMVIVYVMAPMSLAGAWLIHARLPVLIALTALLLIDTRRGQVGLAMTTLSATCLVCAVGRHVSFASQVDGLAELIQTAPPPGIHGGLALDGVTLPGTRMPLFEHLPQWWTARHGGVGHHFFADADHQPVRFVPGGELPARLDATATPEALAHFDALLVLGDGPTLPGFIETARAGRWRRLIRDAEHVQR